MVKVIPSLRRGCAHVVMEHLCLVLLIVIAYNGIYCHGVPETVDNKKTYKYVQKCCAFDEAVAPGKHCKPREPTPEDFSEISIYNSDLTRSSKSFIEVYKLVPSRLYDPEFNNSAINYGYFKPNYYLTEDSKLYQESPNEFHRWLELGVDKFCIDYVRPSTEPNRTLDKIPKKRPPIRYWTIKPKGPRVDRNEKLITSGFLTSCVFLLLVLVVYCLLPDLRNLTGQVLMAYVASLFGAFLILAILQLNGGNKFNRLGCKVMTYATYCFFLSSFCWMNVMSCDIWWTFRGYAKARPIHRRGERFKFLMYCLYAWGLPLAMTLALATLDNVPMRHLPWFVTPNIPNQGCFLGDDVRLLYLYIPMLILILCNWVLFLMTAFNIWRLHRATRMLDSAAAGTPAAHRKQRHRLLIYLKLSVVMGVNWMMEVVSSFYPTIKIWYITDMYNVLIGVCIFLIFVCKKKIYRMLRKRFLSFNESWRRTASQYSKSRSSQSTDSEASQDTPLQVCANPQGPTYIIKA